MTDLGAFYQEFYLYYYESWMDGKGFMGINAEEKTALNSDLCSDSRQMIVGFDNKMVGMYEGQTLAVRIDAKDAYGTQKNPNKFWASRICLGRSKTFFGRPRKPL